MEGTDEENKVAEEESAEVPKEEQTEAVVAESSERVANDDAQEGSATEEKSAEEQVASEDEDDESVEEENAPLSEEGTKYPWYAINAYSGYEERAKAGLEERIRANNLESQFGRIIIPQDTVVELVRGQKKVSKRKFFPGYMLIQMQLNDETWHLVKDTPKVTGFVGDSRNPSPLTEDEVSKLVEQMESGSETGRPRVSFEEGDAVKVVDGPFADFNGTVEDVKPDKGKLRVLISIFGRNTPVELDFVQVEKV